VKGRKIRTCLCGLSNSWLKEPMKLTNQEYAQILRRELLPQVQKPARYIGGEWNQVRKDPAGVAVRVVLAFPDVYEIGISYPGYKILYELLNNLPEVYAERAYSPWPDLEALLRGRSLPLCSLETGTPLHEFDVVGITLQHELSFTNILNLLDLGRVALTSRERTRGPLVLGGGPGAANPEPLAELFDLVVLGDGEEVFPEILSQYAQMKKEPRAEQIRALSNLRGVYAPSRYQPVYAVSGELQGIEPEPGAPFPVRRRVAPAPALPQRPLVPYLAVPHDRVATEVFRGCTRGCRFCQAGMITRPVREREAQAIVDHVLQQVAQTGYEEVSLISLSSGDYSQILPLVRMLMRSLLPQRVALSFPSLRLDSFRSELAETVRRVRKTGLTFAPEAGSARLRKVINKCLEDEETLATNLAYVFEEGWDLVKLYFMVGLPTETEEDVVEIGQLVRRLLAESKRRGKPGRAPRVHLGLSLFVPKPHTPFQWEAQLSPAQTAARLEQLARVLPKAVEYRFGKKERDDLTRSYLEGVLARGDRRLWGAVRRAWELGARFDGWGEHFRFDLWQQAFAETGVDADAYALRARGVDEVLPWAHLDMGTPLKYLRAQREQAINTEQTPDCRTAGCHACGVAEQTECPQPPAAVLAETPGEIPVPPSPERESVRLRLRYQKTGDLRFVGHLDLVNLFRRAARRAHLPLHYSVGFHPQPALSFGPPLSVGYEGLGEWLDLGLDSWRDPRAVVEDLNRMLPAGVRVEVGREVPLSTPSLTDRINAGEYLICWPGAGAHAAELAKRLAEFTAVAEVPGSQWSKKGPVKVNLRSAVVWIKMDATGDGPGLRLLHETGAGSTAKVSTLLEYFGSGWAQNWQAQVTRVFSGRRQGEGITIP
jgi:radical SAM family uncharacterized protein/radical SAM-linked protein